MPPSIISVPVLDEQGAVPSVMWKGKSLEPYNGNPMVRGWLIEQVQDGDRINREDPSYSIVDKCQRYIGGDQRTDTDIAQGNLAYLPRVRFNESRKALQAHASALTDLKAIFQFNTQNPHFKFHGDLLTKRVIYWYQQEMIDLALSDVIVYGLGTGTGDCVVEVDPYAPGGPETTLSARDWRDTLPFRPGTNKDPQKWQGVTIREEHPVNVLRAIFPTKAKFIKPTVDSMLASYMGRFRSTLARITTPVGGTLAGLRDIAHSQVPRSGNALLYRTYLKDYSINLTDKSIYMGVPGANWGYVVDQGDPLYPFGRLIVWNPDITIYDGPNTYFHGLFPILRYQPWQVPWQFAGIPLLHDTMPINDAINGMSNDILLHFKKAVNPQVRYDRNQVSENFMRLYDTKQPGVRVKQNNASGDTGFATIPQDPLPPWTMQFLESLFLRHESLTGTANFQQLLQARSLPGDSMLEKYFDALTPEIRMEGRRFEAFLRPLGEMLKINIFQFDSTARRLQILGEAGLALDDFDFDPGQLIPAMEEGDANYMPEFDKSKPRWQRAQAMWKLLTFTISPHSLLAINNTEQKMIRMQLARMGYYDFWSLMESFEIGNVGEPPPIPLPPLQPPSEEEVLMSMQATLLGQPSKYIIQGGQVLELRTPQTITERLMAQQLLGIGMTENPAGRKASGGSEPQINEKTDETGAPRQTVSESEDSRNA